MYNTIWNRNFIFLTVSNFLMCITYYAIISALPIYLVSDLHAGNAQVGIVLASYTMASVLIRPFSGFALDKFGRRMVFLTSLLLYTFFFAGYLVAFSILFLIILRFVQGLTWGVTTISGATIAVDITPVDQRGEGIGYFSLSTTMGMSVGPVVGLFVAHRWGFTTMFVSGLLISLASFVSASLMHLPKRFVIGRRIHFEWESLFNRSSILPSANLLIIMLTYGALLSFIALFGREIGVHNVSYFFLLFAAGIGISRITAGKAFDRHGPARILTICLLLLVAGFPVLALARNMWGYYGSALIIGFGIGVVFPTFQAMVNNLAMNERRGAANSTLYTALDTGMGLGMILAGIIAQHYRISTVFYMNSFICLVGLIVFRVWVLDYYQKYFKGRKSP